MQKNRMVEPIRQTPTLGVGRHPYLRCASCKNFFPAKMLRLPVMQKSGDEQSCPVCGVGASFTPRSAEEMQALVQRQHRAGRIMLMGSLLGAILVAMATWFTSQ